jgi:hypothetical protein
MDGVESNQIQTLFRWMKEGPPGALPILSNAMSVGRLEAITWGDAGKLPTLNHLFQWHRSQFTAFSLSVPMSVAGARRWLTEQILEGPDRLLFWVCDGSGHVVGHVGLAICHTAERTLELRDIVCGERQGESLVREAVETVKEWVRATMGMEVRDAGFSRAAA